MIAGTLRELIQREPFEPFVIRSSSGQGYKVADPSLIVLMKTKVFVAEPRSDKAATVSYLHIAAVKAAGNGQSRTGRKSRN